MMGFEGGSIHMYWGDFDKSSIERVGAIFFYIFWLENETHYVGECDI